ncbi:hypothetical protein MD484_g5788, partial [Candolleomyces efflorescens]
MQLLRAARDSVIDEEGMKHKVAFGQFITREQDAEVLEAVFRRLEPRRIPAGRLHFTNPDAINAKDQAEEALGAFRDLSVIFECLELACDSEAHPFYSRCFRMLIERWRHIMKWMAYIVTNAPAIANGGHAVLFGMQVLMQTLFLPTTKKTHIYKDELMAMPITVDIICLNLCRPSSTPEHSHPKDGDPCILVSLLEMFLNTVNAPQYFLSRMKSVGSRTRRTVLEFLVLRPQSLLSSYSLRGALITMQSLAKIFGKINVDATLMDDCLELGLVKQYSTALLAMSQKCAEVSGDDKSWKPYWNLVFNSLVVFHQEVVMDLVSNHRKAFRDMGSTLVECALQCLLRVTRATNAEEIEKWLGGFLIEIGSHLSYSDVYRALDADFPKDLFSAVEGREPSDGLKDDLLRFSHCLLMSRQAFDTQKGIVLRTTCSNLKARSSSICFLPLDLKLSFGSTIQIYNYMVHPSILERNG